MHSTAAHRSAASPVVILLRFTPRHWRWRSGSCSLRPQAARRAWLPLRRRSPSFTFMIGTGLGSWAAKNEWPGRRALWCHSHRRVNNVRNMMLRLQRFSASRADRRTWRLVEERMKRRGSSLADATHHRELLVAAAGSVRSHRPSPIDCLYFTRLEARTDSDVAPGEFVLRTPGANT